MHKLTLNDQINNLIEGVDFYSGVEYIVPDLYIKDFHEVNKHSGYDAIATAEPLVTSTWRYPDPVTKLLIYMTGHAGDKLWLTAIVRAIKKHYPDVAIDLVCAPDTSAIFDRNPHVRAIKYPPLPSKALEAYDGLLVLDDVIAELEDPDQPNCYVKLFEITGLPFDYELARPQVFLKHADEHIAFSKMSLTPERGMIEITRGHFVVSLHTSSKVRNMIAPQIIELVKSLHRFEPAAKIYGFSIDEFGASIQQKLLEAKLPNYIPVHNKLTIKECAAVVRTARCVFSADSLFVHLAAATNTPCVALMSTIPPEKRVSTYPFCVPIYKKEQCAFAPCYWHGNDFRKRHFNDIAHAPCYTPGKYMCDVMKVAPSEMLEAANEAMRRRMKFDNFNFETLPI